MEARSAVQLRLASPGPEGLGERAERGFRWTARRQEATLPWFLSDSLPDYSATAEGMVRAHPARNTILLGAAETLRARGLAAFGPDSPLFGWWQQPGTGVISAAFLHTPPFPVALTSMPAETAAALAPDLASRGRPLSGVNGDLPVATAFAAAWHELTGDAF